MTMRPQDEEYYYVTKWALTDGVLMVPRTQARVYADGRAISWGKYFSSAHGNDWHETRSAADARVAEMKERKRASLLKSIEKLDKPVKFKVVADE